MAGALELIADRGEELLARAGGSLPRVSEELPAVAELIRNEPRLRAALTDIAAGTESKKALLQGLLGERVDRATLEITGLLVEHLLSPEQLERAARDLAVRGLLAGAEAEEVLGDVEDELFRFARIIDADRRLRSALTDPAMPPEAIRELLEVLLGDRTRPQTVRLAELVLGTGAERDPSEALTHLAELAAARRGRIVVEARTAVPIDVQRRARLSEALSRATGRSVDLEVVIDPGVVGGVVARVGDELIDGSVKRKLQLALEELTA